MKITDYKIAVAINVKDLESEIMKFVREGWEVYGLMQFHERCTEFWQPMVKRYDPHAGKVWCKVPGKVGVWRDVEAAEADSSRVST